MSRIVHYDATGQATPEWLEEQRRMAAEGERPHTQYTATQYRRVGYDANGAPVWDEFSTDGLMLAQRQAG